MTTFDLTVVSDPTALYPNTRIWHNDLRELTRYDENLLKPGLLFADSVSLLTFRNELRQLAFGHILHARGQGIPQIRYLLQISLRRDPDEMAFYGLNGKLLPSIERAEAFLKAELASDDGVDVYTQFADEYGEAILTYQRSVLEVSRERLALLMSEDLLEAERSGIVSIDGWRTNGDNTDLVWIGLGGDEDYMTQALLDVEGKLIEHSGPLMLEPGSTEILRYGLDLDALPAQSSVTADSLAVSAVGRLPGLRSASISELLDIREDLSDHLPAFREAVIDLAEQINSNAAEGATSVTEQIDRQWHRHIHPALMDIKSKLKRGRYRRHLLDEFATRDGAVAATAGAGLSIGGGTLAGGIAALVPAIAAGAYPFTRALSATLKDRDEAKQHRLYFLYDAQRRLG